jgi:hypothetical protein
MTDHEEHAGDSTGYVPDFERPNLGAIREDNWAEYEVQGFRPIAEDLSSAQLLYGTENVFTGDAYDYDARRPLRHKPGTYVYVSPEGFKLAAEKHRKWAEADRQRQTQSGEGPAAS